MTCLIALFTANLQAGEERGQHSAAGLQEKLASIDRELGQLARPNMRSGAGSIGYRSFPAHGDPQHKEWFQVELGQVRTVERIVLVPTIWRDSKHGPVADGFPLEFRLLAGTGEDSEGEVIASFAEGRPAVAALRAPGNPVPGGGPLDQGGGHAALGPAL